jgi:hypothetical protein
MIQEEEMYLPVNWVDGMNINKKHFITQENSFINKLNGIASLSISPLNFGLVKSNQDFIWMDIDDDIQLLVNFKPAKIILASGFLFDITTEQNSTKNFTCDLPTIENDAICYVILSVNPFSRQPVGMANPSESPVRKPFIVPEMKISVLQEEELSEVLLGLNHLVVGRIKKDQGIWSIDTDYLIASTSIQSNPLLLDVYKRIELSLSSLEKYSLTIVNKIRLKKQDNPLAKAIDEICRNFLDFLSVRMSTYRMITPHKTPIEMFILVMDMARIFKNSLDGWQGCGRDEFMTYISEWCNINEGEFDEAVNQTIKHQYDHNKIDFSVERILHLLSLFEQILRTLSGLDYIGKKIETDLFVKEETLMEEEIEGSTTAKKKRPFFFGKK